MLLPFSLFSVDVFDPDDAIITILNLLSVFLTAAAATEIHQENDYWDYHAPSQYSKKHIHRLQVKFFRPHALTSKVRKINVKLVFTPILPDGFISDQLGSGTLTTAFALGTPEPPELFFFLLVFFIFFNCRLIVI